MFTPFWWIKEQPVARPPPKLQFWKLTGGFTSFEDAGFLPVNQYAIVKSMVLQDTVGVKYIHINFDAEAVAAKLVYYYISAAAEVKTLDNAQNIMLLPQMEFKTTALACHVVVEMFP